MGIESPIMPKKFMEATAGEEAVRRIQKAQFSPEKVVEGMGGGEGEH